ncbi:GNAT family N-acetyltransferase [Xanthomarina gelatinilytica]|uniref:GNAT family N-acetyltransferase n=1 Tax=Xanthomarina gelatinilytica TaxID=1137281 RepID=UPI003AA88806
MEHNIRKCKNSDRYAIYRLVNQLKDKPLDRSIFFKKFSTNLFDKNIEYWLIEYQETVAGFISIHKNQLLHHDEVINEVQEFIIDEPFRNRGLGSKLIGFILKRHENKNIELASNKSRLQSISFYEKHGFKATHNKFTR